MAILARESLVVKSPFKRAARTVLLGGKDPLFDRVAVRELPARAVHRVRNFEDSVCSIGVKTTKTVLSQNLGMLVRKPLRFLITKTDNETISKSAIALLTGVNALAATLSICVYGVIPELFLDTIKVWAVANLIVSAFILTRKNMARFREMAEPEIDELARSTIAMVKES